MSPRRLGFTLIELLIVVAIIAILAAIAVPNFLEAQTRAKIARVKNDMRTMATGLESYFVDSNSYTRDSDSDLDVLDGAGRPFNKLANGAVQLTTPIAYLTSLLQDPFSASLPTSSSGGTAIGYRIGSGSWVYDPAFLPTADTQAADALSWLTNSANSFRRVHSYVTLSPGPDKSRERIGYKCFPWKSTLATEQAVYLDYDPSNGTLSKGDIYRFGGSFTTGDWDRTVAGRGPQGPEAN